MCESPREALVLDHLVQAWNGWLELDRQHPDEWRNVRFHINALSDQVAMRVCQRTMPNVFTMEPTDNPPSESIG